jgi:Carboxypeptidase regulatory-like domain
MFMNARYLAGSKKNHNLAIGWNYRALLWGLTAFLMLAAVTFASVTASISGTVTDPSGAAVVGATVTATNVDTGITTTQQTNGQGYYSFQSLPLGKYNIDVQQVGFKAYRQTGVVLDVNDALVRDVTLQVGQVSEKIEVASDALHVETANTQMGEVIEGKEMTDVPLVTRSYTDLLALQPGVVSTASGMSGAYAGAFISAGFAMPQVSGDLNSGAQSVNGMRETANGFILNGITVQETGYSGAGAIPNLDSIQEFRILTNNFDAEYGNYSGGQINVVTKSGTNDWHGNAFEFFRNTDLDAKNFFDGVNGGQRGAYHQNQFGGTFGGPIKKDKLFFFADYQGNRVIQPETQTITGAPSAATESGDFSGIASSLTGTVNGAGFASQLSTQLGQPVAAGERYYFPGCASAAACVFPNATLSPSAFSPISAKLLSFITPAAPDTVTGSGTGTFTTNSQKLSINDNKFSGRLDDNVGSGSLLSAYYYFDRFDRTDPYWASNAPLYPGFSVDSKGQTHNINLGYTKTFSSAAVNEFRLGYFRLDVKFNQPQGGLGTTLSSLGFASGDSGAPGVFIGTPSVQGIPEIDFNNFVIGVPSRPNHITENIYQIVDNYSMIFGKHTLKFGGQYHYNQLEENLSNVANGNFFFGSNFSGQPSETGSDFVDFLLGAPSQFVQGQSYPSYGRNFYFGLYAQDSWRVKSNLTFNYGIRYDVSAPWREKYNEIQTLIQGEQSVVFPGSPIGWVFPGDPGVPSSLAPTRWNNFAPRLGLAYSFGDHDGMLGKVLGKPGTTSIRVGWGLFYTALEGSTDFNEIGDAPFGNYTGQSEPTFASPFIPRGAGNCGANPCTNLFPVPPPPKNFSAKNPASGPPYDTLSEFYAAFGGIGSSPAFYNKNRLPYAENYELSIQRQVTASDLVSISYVGTQGHSLLSSLSANPGIPALCLALNGPASVLPGTSTCGPGGENNIYTAADGTVTAGTRGPFSAPYRNTPVGGNFIVPFGNDSYFITAGSSSYNSLQLSWRHTSGRLQTLLGYTYSKAMDDSSGYGEQINPVNPRLSRGLSAFDSTHNFVFSYAYTLPFDKLDGPKKLTNGWQISGITRFATGLPVTIVETDDRSLLGTAFGGPITLPVDTPDLLSSVTITDPRKNNLQYFSPGSFGASVLGQEGTANRRFFHGPGTNNWDFALLKSTQLTERVNLQFRAELYNLFNHTQFILPGSSGLVSYSCPSGTTSPVGCVQNASSFGQVTAAAQPRIGQLSLKLNF